MYVQSLNRVLLVPECCVIKLASIMQTTQLPLWNMGGLLHRFGRAEKGLIFILMTYILFCFCLLDFFDFFFLRGGGEGGDRNINSVQCLESDKNLHVDQDTSSLTRYLLGELILPFPPLFGE